MSESEMELNILQRYVVQYREASSESDKCTRELDMREVIADLAVDEGEDLSGLANHWIDRLVSGPTPLLKSCSNTELRNSSHRYHARAYKDPSNNLPAPAWDRIEELERVPDSSYDRTWRNRIGSISKETIVIGAAIMTLLIGLQQFGFFREDPPKKAEYFNGALRVLDLAVGQSDRLPWKGEIRYVSVNRSSLPYRIRSQSW